MWSYKSSAVSPEAPVEGDSGSGKNPPLCSGIAASQLQCIRFLNLISLGASAGISRGPLLRPAVLKNLLGLQFESQERLLA